MIVRIPLSKLSVGPLAQLAHPNGLLCVMGHILQHLSIHPHTMLYCNYPHQLPKQYWNKMRWQNIVGHNRDTCWTKPDAARIIECSYYVKDMPHSFTTEEGLWFCPNIERVTEASANLGFHLQFLAE